MSEKRYLADILDENSVLALESDFEAFSNGARLDKGSKERILSSVMRKAGFGMDKNVNIIKTKKRNKCFVGMLIAAAVAVTGAVAAGATYYVKRNASVDRYFGEGAGEVLESKGLTSDLSFKGSHFDINVETVLSDGYLLTVTASTVPNDEEGAKLLSGGYYPHLSSPMFDGDAQYCAFNGEGGGSVVRWSAILDEQTDKLTVPLEADYLVEVTNEYKPVTNFEISFEKNLDSRVLKNKQGQTLILGEDYICGKNIDLAGEYDAAAFRKIVVEYKDGTVYDAGWDAFGFYPSEIPEDNHLDNMQFIFARLIDMQNVSAVTINNTRFE